jgi:TorA maturation chaperone TorD
MQHDIWGNAYNNGECALAAIADRQMATDAVLADEDRARADLYSLLASLLSSPPSSATLRALAGLRGSSNPFGAALHSLSKCAAAAHEPTAQAEFQDLFVGLGRGELVPYASYYLTGFLQEKPLAQLRRDMARLAIIRSNDTSDPEDHAASILEMMAGLIVGRFGEPASLDQQRDFYDRHIASWMPVFFRDLAGAQSSVLYAAVGDVGRAFLDIETGAFEMI